MILSLREGEQMRLEPKFQQLRLSLESQ